MKDFLQMSKYTKADALFRKYLLSKASRKDGLIYCPLTKKWWAESSIQVCHFIPRAIIHLRYNESNCILCAEYSNVYENSIQLDGETLHIKKFREYLGEETVNELLKIKKEGKLLPKELDKMMEEWNKNQ